MTANTKSTAQFRHWIQATVRAYEGPLIRYVAPMVGLERARDVVQDAFLKLCHQDQGKVEEYVKAWLYTVCRNRALDILRKEKRMVLSDDMDDIDDGARGADPGQSLEYKQTRSQAVALLQNLPDNQREVIRLKFQDGMSYKEIAVVTGLSTTNVGYLIHTGMKTVRQNMIEAGSSTETQRREG